MDNEQITIGSRVEINRLKLKGQVVARAKDKFAVEFFDHETRFRSQHFDRHELKRIYWR